MELQQHPPWQTHASSPRRQMGADGAIGDPEHKTSESICCCTSVLGSNPPLALTFGAKGGSIGKRTFTPSPPRLQLFPRLLIPHFFDHSTCFDATNDEHRVEDYRVDR